MDRRAPPDLNDPTARAAYRGELRRVARPVRVAGVALAGCGLALIAIHAYWLPAIPSLAAYALLGVAAALMLAGIVTRTRYHRRRMRG